MIARRFFTCFLALSAFCLLQVSASANDENNAIIQAAMRFVFQEAGVNDPSVTVQETIPGFARVKIVSISGATDPATAFLKGGNGKWKVVLLGTGFTREDLAEEGIPASLAK